MKTIAVLGAAAVAVGAFIYVRRNPSTSAGKAQLSGSLDGRAFADTDLFSEKYNDAKLGDKPKFHFDSTDPSLADLGKSYVSGAAAGALACAATGPLVIGCVLVGGGLAVAPLLHGPTTSCKNADGKYVSCPCPKARRSSCGGAFPITHYKPDCTYECVKPRPS